MSDNPQEMVRLDAVAKRFVLHAQGGMEIPVFDQVDLSVGAGECVVLSGPSGTGKSTLMRMIFANYRCPAGAILIRHDGEMIDIASAAPHTILDIRKRTLGYVSQFLRVVPRVPTLEIVAEPLIAHGEDPEVARRKAAIILERLNLPEPLWSLPPATFSGGEQQRVNLARGFVVEHPILLLDEPTASLDKPNRAIVVEMIKSALAAGTAIIGIFHDYEVRDQVASREFDVTAVAAAA